jgi:hypothetical protein
MCRQSFCQLIGQRERKDIAAHRAYTQRHSGTLLQLKIIARAAVATHAQIFDVFGAPELRILREGKAAVHGTNNRKPNAHSRRKDLFNSCVQVAAVAHDLVADNNIFHPWMLLDFHCAALFQIHIAHVLLVVVDIIGYRLGLQHMLDHLL